MISKKSNIIIATLVALFSFFTVAYISCSKPGAIVSCSGGMCENDGFCHVDTITKIPVCVCPTGFEGSNCATVSVNKYIGGWNLRQIIIGSDSTAYNNDTTNYPVTLQQTATPTTFFINNFFDDKYYNGIICTLDSTNSSIFTIDTISAYHMVYSHFIIQGGYGYIARDTINATLYIQFKNASTNWQIDTVALMMTAQ